MPVCSRPSLNPAFRNDSDKPTEGASFILPAGIRRDPSHLSLIGYRGKG